MHYYNTKFIVKTEHTSQFMKNAYFAHEVSLAERCATIRVIPVIELLELTNDEYYKDEKGRPQKLIIEPHLWKNIALIYVCKKNLSDLVNKGAKIMDISHVYDTEIDAKIQLAFVCAKHLVEQKDVYQVTDGQMDARSYGSLVNMFYADFPEKFI